MTPYSLAKAEFLGLEVQEFWSRGGVINIILSKSSFEPTPGKQKRTTSVGARAPLVHFCINL